MRELRAQIRRIPIHLLAECGVVAVRSGEDGSSETTLMEAYLVELHISEIGLREAASRKHGMAEIGFTESGPDKTTPPEKGLSQIGTAKIVGFIGVLREGNSLQVHDFLPQPTSAQQPWQLVAQTDPHEAPSQVPQ